MGSRYLLDLYDVVRGAGLPVVQYEGWQSRARSTGGYEPGRPAVVMVHHTASNTAPINDASYMCDVSDNRPVANLMLTRDGEVWILAAGATNTNGKGGPIGTVPADSMNTHAIGIEACNDGVGEPWPDVMQDAYLILVEALCVTYDITQVYSHAEYTLDGRKIDPAGPSRWPPVNSSGTWDMDEFRADLQTGDDDMLSIEEIKQALRDVLNEAAVFGSDGTWANSEQILHDHVNQTFNAVVAVDRELDELTEGDDDAR